MRRSHFAIISLMILVCTQSAMSLTINASATSASISVAGEVDWHSFVVTTSGTYIIETTAGTLTDNYMYLYGPGNQTTLIEEDDDDGVGNAAMITRTLSAGTYYVKVRAYAASSTGTYTIRVTSSAPPTTTSVLLTINASATSGSIGVGGENDWYRFVVATSGSYTIETTAGTLTDNYMYLYGPNNQTTLIEEDDDDGIGNAAMITRTLSAGTYYVKVRAYATSSTGTYTIRVTKVISGPVVTSFAINSGASSTSSRSVTLNNGCSGSPTQYLASESSSFSGALWQTYSTAPLFTLSSGNGTGTVYFKVKNSSGQESAVVNDTIALNSTIVPLTVDGPVVTGNISSGGDIDWFRFTVSTASIYKIETTAGTLIDNYMYLYGPNNQTTLIEEDDDDGVGSAAMISRTLSAGTYYVKVRAYSASSTGTYTIVTTSPLQMTVWPDKLVYRSGDKVIFTGTLKTSTGKAVSGVRIGIDDSIRQICTLGPTTDILGNFRYEVSTYNSRGIYAFVFYGGKSPVFCNVSVNPIVGLSQVNYNSKVNLGNSPLLSTFNAALSIKYSNLLTAATQDQLKSSLQVVTSYMATTGKNALLDYVSNPVNDVVTLASIGCAVGIWTGVGTIPCSALYTYQIGAGVKSLAYGAVVAGIDKSNLSSSDKTYWKDMARLGKCVVGIASLDPTKATIQVSEAATGWSCASAFATIFSDINNKKILSVVALPPTTASNQTAIGYVLIPK